MCPVIQRARHGRQRGAACVQHKALPQQNMGRGRIVVGDKSIQGPQMPLIVRQADQVFQSGRGVAATAGMLTDSISDFCGAVRLLNIFQIGSPHDMSRLIEQETGMPAFPRQTFQQGADMTPDA